VRTFILLCAQRNHFFAILKLIKRLAIHIEVHLHQKFCFNEFSWDCAA